MLIAASTLLFLIGLLDLTRAAPGTNRLETVRRSVPWALCVIAIGALIPVVIRHGWIPTLLVAAGYAIWSATYHKRVALGWRIVALAVIVVVVVVLLSPLLLSLIPSLSPPIPSQTASPGLTGRDPESCWAIYTWALLTVAVLLINMATANRIVRLVLDSVHGSSPRETPAPPAGRVIGVLERLLLMILLLAGQGVPIAGVAAAKGIIRYPEINRTVREETRSSGPSGSGLSAEIFFIGTVTSWLVALGTVGIIALAVAN